MKKLLFFFVVLSIICISFSSAQIVVTKPGILSISDTTYMLGADIKDYSIKCYFTITGDNIKFIDPKGYKMEGKEYNTGILIEGNNCTIQMFDLQNFGVAILNLGNGNIIQKNDITGNGKGVCLKGNIKDNKIRQNNITENGDGIALLTMPNNNSISQNNISKNVTGILLYIASYNNILRNILSDNQHDALSLFLSYNNEISGNIGTGNGWWGINLFTTSRDNFGKFNEIASEKGDFGTYENGNEVENITSISSLSNQGNMLLSFQLFPNYPNPFNPITVISYQLPEVSDVELSIYNLTGQKVATLVSGEQPAGDYKYQWDASEFASGVYIYALRAGGRVMTKKMFLVK